MWRAAEELNWGNFSADFRGRMCRNCRILVLGYSPEILKPYRDDETD